MVVAVVQWNRSAELLPGTLTSSYVKKKENGKSKNVGSHKETNRSKNPPLPVTKKCETKHY